MVVPMKRDIFTVMFSYPMTWVVSTACFLWYYNKSHWLERVQAKYSA